MTSLDDIVGQKLLLSFVGKEFFSSTFGESLRRFRPAGVVLFRHHNVDSPAQIRALCSDIQASAASIGLPPLLIACDQEGGQLLAIGDGMTQLPGNLALGATGSQRLAREAGRVLGQELGALGINVNFAPCCDVNSNANNPVIGTRSFGEDSKIVSELATALIVGMQSEGIAATAKHFPGHGDTAVDSHHALPVILHDRKHLEQVELPPFIAAVENGVKLIMTGHLAVPSIEGVADIPATMSRKIITEVLREQLKFDGVVVTDHLDMRAVRQGDLLGEEAVRAVAAGVDLLLLSVQERDHIIVFENLKKAVMDGTLAPHDLARSAARVTNLKNWLAGQSRPLPISQVGCREFRAVADEIAQASITLVRDEQKLIPLRQDRASLALITPAPRDLVAADTSSYVSLALAGELRRYGVALDEYQTCESPAARSELLRKLHGYDTVILGTVNAYSDPNQVEFARAVIRLGVPTVVVALRMPYDIALLPEATTFLCSYSILEPSMRALAAVLLGKESPVGRLPVSILV